jgi:uncharacterized membrane protein YvbJ
MSLIECPECKKQISDKALKCPQCGAPIASISSPTSTGPSLSKKGNKIRIILLALLVALLVIIVGVSYWFWRASTSNRAAPPSAGLSAGLRQPVKAVDQQVELKEGQYVSYSFALRTDARVQVQLNAQPKHVDVMLMTKEEADKFRQVSGSLSGGQYTYRQALSSKQVLRMDKTEILPKGEWTIIVMRPSEALLFRKGTSVNIIVTVY